MMVRKFEFPFAVHSSYILHDTILCARGYTFQKGVLYTAVRVTILRHQAPQHYHYHHQALHVKYISSGRHMNRMAGKKSQVPHKK